MPAQIDVKTLEGHIRAGDIDMILCVFVDMQGRFMGKRVMGDYFVEETWKKRACTPASTS